ncbi:MULTISPECIES: aliphatic sulfonate ABC transporter substrate-binding protein [unclassified Rathayibacter]|uniref:aliphatic sulfonate ABC transporter substrate-binding protein n=1 Tax=unclassified Rathayibacter TaxID=2609250 RepID=UPI001FB1B537|nr:MULTISPECIES: aliphatic sulfonate ABC transporter substrate-binding protein [unclassified Rathayibacter]MCJ1673500.1 aliphatic sulfonate ABC transporter substrate-binding protein [Rathayibacter sp. VKM Ac-2929]MCJ1681621.1 aliphatic sulfonate ABC transporter substrate-binding protein [Rathayibacter sp. VKM Ac-2928]
MSFPSFSTSPLTRRTALAGLLTAAAVPLLAGCVQGEGGGGAAAAPAASDGSTAKTQGGTLTLDFATYNPLSLVIKEKGWLEAALAEQDVTVTWVQSAGSNKANEALRAGAIDVGSTAGSAALLARSNGSPIRTIDIFSQPEWSALVVPAGSAITSVEQLAGKQIAATSGTDPYFFLVQALEAAGLSIDDVTVQNLQHADGWAALQNGSVDAWAGLDPIMAGAEAAGATLLYRNVDFNSYGLLNATESFLAAKPDLAQTVVNAYEHARAWALENQEETASILASVAGLDVAVATTVISERSNLDVDNVPGSAQTDVLAIIGPIFVANGDVATQEQVDAALDSLIDDSYASAADPSAIA